MATAMRNGAEMPSLTEASFYSISDVNGKISLAIRKLRILDADSIGWFFVILSEITFMTY